jgi:N-methylhydantoinase B
VLERDPQHVLDDVLDGKISVERARNVYGVVVDVAREQVDVSATQAERARR